MLEMSSKIIDDSSNRSHGDFDRLIPLADVRKILALSWPMVTALVREGVLPAYSVSGRPVRRTEVTEHTRGLRVPESALREYIESIRVR